MNLESNNLEGDLNKSLDDIVKGMKKDGKKKGGHRNQRGRGNGGRGRGLMYARRSPGFARGGYPRVREAYVRGGEYVQIVRPRYRQPRYVEAPRYRVAAPMYVERRYPRYQRVQSRAEYRRIAEDPIHVEYEEIPRRDIRLEGTARAPRLFDRLDANRARRRQEFNRRRQESGRGNQRGNKI